MCSIFACLAPATPVNVTVTANYQRRLRLTWAHPSGDRDNYVIFYSRTGVAEVEVTVAATEIMYELVELDSGYEYSMKMAAKVGGDLYSVHSPILQYYTSMNKCVIILQMLNYLFFVRFLFRLNLSDLFFSYIYSHSNCNAFIIQ